MSGMRNHVLGALATIVLIVGACLLYGECLHGDCRCGFAQCRITTK